MENGTELLRLLAQLGELDTKNDQLPTQKLMAWSFSVSIRELATSVLALSGVVAGIVAENNLTLDPESTEHLRKVADVSAAIAKASDRLAKLSEPPEDVIRGAQE